MKKTLQMAKKVVKKFGICVVYCLNLRCKWFMVIKRMNYTDLFVMMVIKGCMVYGSAFYLSMIRDCRVVLCDCMVE